MGAAAAHSMAAERATKNALRETIFVETRLVDS